LKWLRRNRWRMTALSLGSLALTIGTLQFKGPDPAITILWWMLGGLGLIVAALAGPGLRLARALFEDRDDDDDDD
jgi:hypothetical protein